MPAHQFQYDYQFSHSKTSKISTGYEYTPHPAINSWIFGPYLYPVVDRNFDGLAACWMELEPSEFQHPVGYSLLAEYCSGDITHLDYFCLTRMTLPSGGNELFWLMCKLL